MIPATIDFLLRTNADYREEIPFKDGTAPFDLSGLSFTAQVRRFAGGPLVFSPSIVVLDAEQGIVEISASRQTISSSYNLVVGNQIGRDVELVHDIIVTHVDGYREPWAEGKVVIRAGVTINA